MGLELKSYSTDMGRVASYLLTHGTPGREGTILSLVVKVSSLGVDGHPRTKAEIIGLDPSVDGDAEAALDKLAERMERAAAAIRARGSPSGIVSSYGGKAEA